MRIVLIVIGVLGAAGAYYYFYPYQNYKRRALTTEAIDQLDKLYKGSAAYYASPASDPSTGEKQPCQFPRSVAITPSKSCCDSDIDRDGDGRCDGGDPAWSDEVWGALNVAMMFPHNFRYAYTSNGKTGAEAEFTISAYADLDCDGVFSTFQRGGKGSEPTPDGECTMRGSSTFFKQNEVE